MTEWTAERLDALPEGTLIDVQWPTMTERLHKPAPGKWWSTNLGDRPEDCDVSSEDLADNPNIKSIRGVSVPVDALLSDEAIRASAQYPEIQASRMLTQVIIRDAIAHITGEEHQA